MSKNRMKQIQPYEGDQPYLYFAFAEEDCGRVRKTFPASFCSFWCATAAASAPARYTLFSGSMRTAWRKD